MQASNKVACSRIRSQRRVVPTSTRGARRNRMPRASAGHGIQLAIDRLHGLHPSKMARAALVRRTGIRRPRHALATGTKVQWQAPDLDARLTLRTIRAARLVSLRRRTSELLHGRNREVPRSAGGGAAGRDRRRKPGTGAAASPRRRCRPCSRGDSGDIGTAEAGGARSAARTDRSLPRRSDRADPHGEHLSARGRRGRALGEGEPEPEGQGARGCAAEGDVGRERQGADGGAAGPQADEREARLDAEARRRLPRRPEGGAEDGAVAAQQGRPGGQPEVDPRADGEDGDGGEQDRVRDRVGQARDGLRADVQPEHDLRPVVVHGVPAVLHVPAGLRLRPRARVRHRRLRRRRDLGQLQLGRQQRRHQRQQVQQLQQGEHQQRQLQPQRRASQGRCLQGPGRGAEVQPRRRCQGSAVARAVPRPCRAGPQRDGQHGPQPAPEQRRAGRPRRRRS